ncbi:MAG: (2Fe-2S)-binding protein [Bacteroidales bacterium]|nr:(2Fe-2S)-binding protein [Bacteroidales bacterium]
MKELIKFNLNGKPVEITTDSDRLLLWVIRTDLGLTGTKYGCGESLCGACTVIVDNEAVRSCQTTLKDVENRSVITIEGLAVDGQPNILQKAFMDHDALQCGYCTPGMLMNAWAMLKKNPHPTREQIIEEMDDNLCRCGAHKRIIEAVETVSKEMGG